MTVDSPQADAAVRKILIGTMKALSRQGTQKLSVSDICKASHVARGTFYRYFNNKEEVLSAVGRHFEVGITAAFEAAIEADPDPGRRVAVVLNTLIDYPRLRRRLEPNARRGTGSSRLALIRDTFPNLGRPGHRGAGPGRR